MNRASIRHYDLTKALLYIAWTFLASLYCEKVILYFLCHAQILAHLSTCSTERDRLRPSTPCATVLIIWQLFPT